ncbi:MAG: hypothetical protein IKP47_11835 [Ruminococcus sp.]|nr:hypothetical protein [Ruminococcus sp.]
MAQKICRSCGQYYKGEYCDKCGYGKPEVKSKELEKLKKKTPKKPVRFMTPEEIQAAGKEKKQAAVRKQDPNARRNFLIVIALVSVGIIIWVLISKGLLFTNNRDDVIKQYFTALDTNNFDKFVDTLPSEIKDAYKDEKKQMGLGGEDYMLSFKKDLTEVYGAGLSIKVELGSEEQIDKGEITEDLSGYKAAYGSAPSVSEAYIVNCEVTYSGQNKSETVEYDCYIGKVGWKWKIFNMEFKPGIAQA